MPRIDYKNIRYIRIIVCLAFSITYALLWLIPSNIGRLIARDRDILLGRYSLERMALLIFFPVLIAPVLYLLFSPDKKKLKIRIFQMSAILMILLPGLFIQDLAMRYINQSHYVETDKGFHRPSNQQYEIQISDKPELAGIFQKIRPGYPDMNCKLSTDSMGFRNRKDYDTCDILALGDSFVEGSNVSDENTWPEILSELTGKSVCNIGMSGTDPLDYYYRFKNIGLAKKPKTVVLMIYEGNDFSLSGTLQQRIDALNDGFSKPMTFSRRIRKFRKTSPVILGIRHAIINLCSSSAEKEVLEEDVESVVNATNEKKKLEAISENEESLGKGISWLPVKVPDNEKGKYYHFPPKRMLSFYHKKNQFKNSIPWKCAEYALLKMKSKCDENGIRLIIVFAPTKPHVVIPLVKERISPEIFHAFAKLKIGDIPDAETFTKELFDNMNVVKDQISEFCRENNLEFVDPSDLLRQEMQKGNQVYFTYDQHWTPPGNRLTAEKIAETIKLKE